MTSMKKRMVLPFPPALPACCGGTSDHVIVWWLTLKTNPPKNRNFPLGQETEVTYYTAPFSVRADEKEKITV